jgi:hypothetical protein
MMEMVLVEIGDLVEDLILRDDGSGNCGDWRSILLKDCTTVVGDADARLNSESKSYQGVETFVLFLYSISLKK